MVVDYLVLAAVGFGAQIVDGTLGMAFGVISTSALLSFGIAPAQASAIVHTAEIFTTGASAASHLWHRNVDWRLVARLGGAGVLGAVLGAWILSNVDASAARPYVSAYLAIIGGLLAAPLGGWSVKRIPPRLLMISVGVLVTLLAAWQLARTFKLV